MAKYRIVDSEAKIETEPVIEVRLVNNNGDPTLEARNSGEGWWPAAWLTEEGRLGLGGIGKAVKGLDTNKAGEIKTF